MNNIYDTQGQATQAMRRFQLPDQTDTIKASTEHLDKLLAKLEERLAPVLRTISEPEACNPRDAVPEPALVPAAEYLRGIGRHLEFLIRRVNSLTERIEA